jgi:transcriptional regulator with XRE-family HTH domain
MHISSNIRHLRKSSGLTQEELAKRLNKHTVSISDYEKGKSTPPIDVALQLCDIFGVDLNGLVTRDLQKEEILKTQPETAPENADYTAYLQEQYETLKRLTTLQDQRVQELEREIREHAPGLARRLGL